MQFLLILDCLKNLKKCLSVSKSDLRSTRKSLLIQTLYGLFYYFFLVNFHLSHFCFIYARSTQLMAHRALQRSRNLTEGKTWQISQPARSPVGWLIWPYMPGNASMQSGWFIELHPKINPTQDTTHRSTQCHSSSPWGQKVCHQCMPPLVYAISLFIFTNTIPSLYIVLPHHLCPHFY